MGSQNQLGRRGVLRALALTGGVVVTGIPSASADGVAQESRTTWTAEVDSAVGDVAVSGGLTVAGTDAALHGFDAATGDDRFTYTDGYSRSYLDRGRPFVTTDEGALRRLSATSGKRQWSVDIGKGVNKLFAFTADAVVAEDDGEATVCFETADGIERWRAADDYATIPAGVHDGVAVTAFGSAPKIAAGYDLASGERVYGITHETSYNSFSVQDGYLVTSGSDPTVTHVWDASTGEKLWTGDGYYFLGAHDGAFFVGGQKGLQRVDTDAWRTTWAVPDATMGFLSGMRDGVAYFAGSQGASAVTLDGTLRWNYDDSTTLPVVAPAESGVYYRNAESLVHLAHDGTEEWTTAAPSTDVAAGYVNTGVSSDHFVTGTKNGRVLAYADSFSPLDAGATDSSSTDGTTTAGGTTNDDSFQSTTDGGTTNDSDGKTDESTASSPGFGVVTTVVAVVAGILAIIRGREDDG